MAIKAIIWDVGGVMERTEDHNPRKALAARLGWEPTDLENLIFGNNDNHRAQLGQISYPDHWQNVAQALGISDGQVWQVRDEFFAGDQLDYALVDQIRTLKQRYTTAILSNYMSVLREQVENQWKIGDAFDHLIISSEVGVMKPDPRIYQIALKKTGCQPHEAVFLDDFIQNVEGAQNVGMHAILFKNPQQALADLHKILKTN